MLNMPKKSKETIVDKNNERNQNFYGKVAFLRYTERIKFRSQSM